MDRLLAVELTRLRWRRAVVLLVIVAVAGVAATFAATAWNTRPYSAAETASIHDQVQRDRHSPQMQAQVRECVDNPVDYGLDEADPDLRTTCEQSMLPQEEWYLSRQPLDLRHEHDSGSGLVVIVLLAVAMALAGTTFAGHDWNTGSMSNQLLFESRRACVWAAKALAVCAVSVVVAGVVLTAYWSGLWALAAGRGLHPSHADVSTGYHQALRGTVLVTAMALGGYALTMLFRSTVATLGVVLGVSILAPVLLALAAFPGNERWMPQTNVAAVVLDGTTYQDDSCTLHDTCERRLGVAGGSAYLLALLAASVVPSVTTFRRRDVP